MAGQFGNQNAAFYGTERIERAEAALDVWASVKHAAIAGVRGFPILAEIFEQVPDAPDDGSAPEQSPRPNSVKRLDRRQSNQKHSVMLESGERAMALLVWFVERYEERFVKGTDMDPLAPSKIMQIVVDGWLVDIGHPFLLERYLLAVYPRGGVYQQPGHFREDWLFGTLRPGRSSKHFARGYEALHRSAVRDLADYLDGFGSKRTQAAAHEAKQAAWKAWRSRASTETFLDSPEYADARARFGGEFIP